MEIEMKRKLLHLSGLLVPLLYVIVGKEWSIVVISIALIVFFMIEPLRVYSLESKKIVERMRPYVTEEMYRFLNERIDKLTKSIKEIEREEERLCIGAHIYFAVASLIVIILFPKWIVIGAIAVATLGDALAAVIGKKYGKHRFRNGKSWEGSTAFFITSFIVLLLVLFSHYPIEYVILAAIIGSIVGALVELYNVPPNDNFSNQIFISLALYVLTFMMRMFK
ncbi:diacylglycerol/polyprenol kinase family protein [Aciduliprofundum sp. MAR08-339]|uniref:diacylglycerol/polyprenol kinase family protein n=1 Tax=Aciduliprofundum sp. (strain MAR08-339) TaxID=673860 RepID=UPI00064F657F